MYGKSNWPLISAKVRIQCIETVCKRIWSDWTWTTKWLIMTVNASLLGGSSLMNPKNFSSSDAQRTWISTLMSVRKVKRGSRNSGKCMVIVGLATLCIAWIQPMQNARPKGSSVNIHSLSVEMNASVLKSLCSVMMSFKSLLRKIICVPKFKIDGRLKQAWNYRSSSSAAFRTLRSKSVTTFWK